MKIVTESPDVEALLLPVMDAGTAPYEWFVKKPATTGAYRHGIVRADLQGHVTPISRYCRVGLTGWAVDAAGRVDFGAARALVAAGCRTLETASGSGFILHAETQSGPIRTIDDVSKQEIAYATVLLEVVVI